MFVDFECISDMLSSCVLVSRTLANPVSGWGATLDLPTHEQLQHPCVPAGYLGGGVPTIQLGDRAASAVLTRGYYQDLIITAERVILYVQQLYRDYVSTKINCTVGCVDGILNDKYAIINRLTRDMQ